MPEFWIPYGEIEIVIDLKSENLSFFGEPNWVKEPILNFDFLSNKERILLSFYKFFPSVRKFLEQVKDLLKGKEVLILTEDENKYDVKRIFEGLNVKFLSLGEDTRELKGTQRIFINQFGFDALFGFSSSYSSFFRMIDKRGMIKIIKALKEIIPMAGKEAESFQIIKDSLKMESWVSVELLPSKEDFLIGFYGDLEYSYEKAKEALMNNYAIEAKRFKGLILSPGYGIYSSNLSLGLKALWNTYASLEENSPVILACEASDGLGSQALEYLIYDKLDLNSLEKDYYVEGLEDILFLKALKEKNLMIVSTLPHFYTQAKLGFQTFDSVKDAVNYVLTTYGAKSKLAIIPHAFNTLLKPSI